MSGKNGLGAFLYVSVSALTALGIIYHAQIVQELVRHYEFAENLFPGERGFKLYREQLRRGG